VDAYHFFHTAYDALAANQLKYLQLKGTKVGNTVSMLKRGVDGLFIGVELDVPASTTLPCFDSGQKCSGGKI